MTALLIHDLNEPMHAGNPKMPLVNPQQIFSQGSFHGGAWRCAFTFDSIGAPSVSSDAWLPPPSPSSSCISSLGSFI